MLSQLALNNYISHYVELSQRPKTVSIVTFPMIVIPARAQHQVVRNRTLYVLRLLAKKRDYK